MQNRRIIDGLRTLTAYPRPVPKLGIAPFDDVSGGELAAALRRRPLLVAAPAAVGALAGLAYVLLGDASPRNVVVGLLGGLVIGALIALAAGLGRAPDE
jgi:hypothetical protein